MTTTQSHYHVLNELTPVQFAGDYWLKRDDLFQFAGISGGKVRTALSLIAMAKDDGYPGVVTAGSRESPQVEIVARVAAALNMRCRVHVPSGKPTFAVEQARAFGAIVMEHVPGYNTVIIARARQDATALGWPEIPFGMECGYAIDATAHQTANLPAGRVVLPVGSGMSLMGVLYGVGPDRPVLGVVVGASPIPRLDKWMPHWRDYKVELVPSGLDYHKHVNMTLAGIRLDPVYEAKAVTHLELGDIFWIVGIRNFKEDMREGT